ncbi:hypothetical protein DH2020_016819 [Rehmannia glutinosa]|uniref:Myb/SANT-like domain-containing protein n=1 Tax=Rehmannia glutinosa TaxID=99300 RepID=A0ABR0WSK9_REHGL
MDSHLALILTEQMVLGYKCDGDTWKPKALQAVVTYLNAKLHLNLTKDNIKNRLKNWKRHFNVVSDIQTKQSGFAWDEERKMIVVTTDEWSSWAAYVESHPDAKGMQNKMIENWDGIVLLCGKDRATVKSLKLFKKIQKHGQDHRAQQIPCLRRKKSLRKTLIEAVGTIATSFQEFLASKKKNEEKPSGIEIHDVVSSIPKLSSDDVFKAVRKLMNGDPEEFKLLKVLPDGKKNEWIYFLINS